MSTRTHLKNPFKCESHTGEYDLSVLVTKPIRRYVAKQNWQSVPSGWVAAEGDF
jgi:hypothetical protein